MWGINGWIKNVSDNQNILFKKKSTSDEPVPRPLHSWWLLEDRHLSLKGRPLVSIDARFCFNLFEFSLERLLVEAKRSIFVRNCSSEIAWSGTCFFFNNGIFNILAISLLKPSISIPRFFIIFRFPPQPRLPQESNEMHYFRTSRLHIHNPCRSSEPSSSKYGEFSSYTCIPSSSTISIPYHFCQ